MLIKHCLFAVIVMTISSRAMAESKVLAAGEWSKPVTDNLGAALRGRLVLVEKERTDDRREVIVYVELQDASQAAGRTMQLYCDLGRNDFRPEYKSGLHCEMQDKNGRAVPGKGFPFSGGVPKSQWITLPSDATIRLRASPFGIHRQKALAIAPQLDKLWVIAENDLAEYLLSGTFTIDPGNDRNPPAEGHVWRGTLTLPGMRIPNAPKNPK